ncbi:MAG: mannonate dehydratase [Victivallaceae bacterium]|nr:mannonate dehydratase [Victivallaceae bacterium]
MIMQECMRYYGPGDMVSLSDIRQAGCEGVVSSLHQIAYGEVWPVEEIRKRQKQIADAGMVWSVVESLPVHDDIKNRTGAFRKYLENYKISIRNLAECGIHVITYNFMPVLDWIRTDLEYQLPDGSKALYFNRTEFAAFELFVLRRVDAEKDYTPAEFAAAKRYFDALSSERRAVLERNIIDNFPGFKGVTLATIREALARAGALTDEVLREHLRLFLEEVTPVCLECGSIMTIHPDDPPFPILGLPRIFSTIDDIETLLRMVDNPANGICFCSGSFSGRRENDIVAMFRKAAPRVGFVHLRSTAHDGKGNFYEANHLEGVVDMYHLVKEILAESQRRKEAGRADWRIPMRPDHGHTMLDDLRKPMCANPGYTAIGRMKGLAELRGLELGVLKSCFPALG